MKYKSKTLCGFQKIKDVFGGLFTFKMFSNTIPNEEVYGKLCFVCNLYELKFLKEKKRTYTYNRHDGAMRTNDYGYELASYEL